MVDFDNEATIGTPAVDVQRISILERRYDLFEAIEDYKKKTLNNTPWPLSFVRARLLTLFLEMEPMIKRHSKTDEQKLDYKKIYNVCMKDEDDEDKIFKVIFKLNNVLDAIRLTRIDTKQQYDPQDMEKENAIKGY